MIDERLYSPKEASEILGVHVKTLQVWDRKGIIKAHRTPNGRRKFSQTEINRLLNNQPNAENNILKNDVAVAIYGRVSSHEQKVKGDLDRQVGSILMKIENQKMNQVITITDVGSGLNDKRKGLLKLMELAKDKKISKVYITYKDRLTRFGFNYLELCFKSHGTEIIVLNDNKEDKSPQEELMEDLMSIITSFSGKIYGLRSGKNKKVEEDIKKTLESNL